MTDHYARETRLSDGPLVVTHAMSEAQSVAIGIFIDIGSRDEQEYQHGISHALEHMLFKGTEELDVHALSARLDELGGHANAYTSRERTCFHMQVLHEHWQEALSLLSGMVCRPALPQDEWQREREVIYSEMAMVEDSPEEWVMDQHVAALFPSDALGRNILGTHDSLQQMQATDLRAYLQQYYAAPYLLIAAAGNIDHEQLVAAVSAIDWRSQGGARPRLPVTMQAGMKPLPREGEQAHLVVSYPGIHAASDERPLAWLANQMLGGGMSSRLFREVREKRGLAYSISSHLSMLSDQGIWTVMCGCAPAHAVASADVLREVIDRFAEDFEAREFDRAMQQLSIQFRMGMDSVEGQMLYLGSRLDEVVIRSPLHWVERVQQVSLHELREWVRDRLQQKALWSVAAPKAELAKICDSIGPCLN